MRKFLVLKFDSALTQTPTSDVGVCVFEGFALKEIPDESLHVPQMHSRKQEIVGLLLVATLPLLSFPLSLLPQQVEIAVAENVQIALIILASRR